VTIWVALLRGVNVGGITVKSVPLRDVFIALGFDDVRTVLASGNVVFSAARADDGAFKPEAALKAEIERALGEEFGYAAWIVLQTRAQVDAAARGFPFDADIAERQPMVIFGSDDLVLAELAEAAASMNPVLDPVRLGDGALYWNPAKGSSTTTPFAKLLAKAQYKARTTSRNLRTLEKVLAATSR
jgi:uncharacterized protein (DUF1697 family)